MNIKKSTSAGTFYPADKYELEKMISILKKEDNLSSNYKSRAIIVPHAGIIYSGALAANGYKFLDKNAKNVFIIAPAHYERLYGCGIADYDAFETPLGQLETNKEILKELEESFNGNINNSAFEKEHSLEVQLPFIQTFLPNAKIIPVLYGCEDYNTIKNIIKHFWTDMDNVFVISSDLSHFYPEKEALRMDYYTAGLIENNETRNFESEMACGAVGICGLVEFSKGNNFSLIRIGITNSGEITGNSSRVVGYGSWFLYEGSYDDYLKKYYSDYIIEICKRSILTGLNLGDSLPKDFPAALKERGACFVTIQIHKNLRGCIGSVIAHRPLIEDLIKNAHAAAFSDPRFNALTLDEFSMLNIEVSLLSKPERIIFEDHNDLFEKIEPFKDGIIIRDGNNQGVYLPTVWEQLPDKKAFMESLKNKAGLDKNHFSNTMEVFKFKTTVITED